MKEIKQRIFFLCLLLTFLSLLFISVVSAASPLPIGLQKILEYNQESTEAFALKISFFIAFVAGMLGILSPCILPFIPAYFSYTFKEKQNITKMTLVFFLGFSLVFTTMGVIAGFLGQQSLAILQEPWLMTLAGILLISLGIMTLLGKGFSSFFTPTRKLTNDVPGIFLFGTSYALGWSACVGPILVSILGIGAILHDPWYSGTLLFFYSLGNLVPLFLISIFYDRFNLANSRFIKGKLFTFSIDEKKYYVHSTNLIAGIFLLIIGIVVIIYQGTSVVNTWDIFNTRSYFYAWQDKLIAWEYAQPFSVAVFILFVAGVSYFLWKQYRNPKKTSE
ncbi:cytochrome c biogenesis protein CcdA [Candidatus Woesearchaeota archaeon]|nr:cytochrome c biogenesis protein CcdA [Candidatus Woesearchaeota archaeon]